jgi:hypothetical protein
MNPLKRKKLYRLELTKQKNNLVVQETKQEKPVVETVAAEPVKLAETVQQAAPVGETSLDMGLKLLDNSVEQQITDAVTTDNKKEKKKKYSSQD